MNSNSISTKTSVSLDDLTWFPVSRRREIYHEIERLTSQDVTSLRLGIDCAKFNTKKGQKWYDWLVPTLAANFELELCFDNFSNNPASPQSRKLNFSEIVEHFILKHGQHFTLVELWRNPAKRGKEENSENIFSEDVVFTATWAKHLGKKVSLGGIQPVDFEWITQLISCQFLSTIEHLNIDRETDDQRSTNSRFYERTLRSLFEAKGVKTQIKTYEIQMLNLQPPNKGIAC